ncbi:MAG: 3-dehydroquinate synthase [Chitinophagales bacterium]
MKIVAPHYADSIDTLQAQLIPALRHYSSIFVLTDTEVREYCYPLLQHHLPPHHGIEMDSGESQKSLDNCVFIWETLSRAAADRHAVLINLGGGMVGDIGGFAASTYKRGIDFIHIPTTLLAMVDASIGGKTGIDFGGNKNQIGTFSMPKAIFSCTAFLETLPPREWRAGFAEMLKHFLLADEAGYRRMVATDTATLQQVSLEDIQHAAAIKLSIVSRDPQEKNIRKSLNLGHTLGHAIESALLEDAQDILHGEAVALGLMAAAFLSWRTGRLPAQDYQQLARFILGLYGFEWDLEPYTERIITYLKNDKKNRNGQIRFVLLKGIGQVELDVTVGEAQAIAAVQELSQQIKNYGG